MIHSNSEGDIYIEEMPLPLVHLREEADARLSDSAFLGGDLPGVDQVLHVSE